MRHPRWLILVLATTLLSALSACNNTAKIAACSDGCAPEPKMSEFAQIRERLRHWEETRLRFIKSELFAPSIHLTVASAHKSWRTCPSVSARFLEIQNKVRTTLQMSSSDPVSKLPKEMRNDGIVQMLLHGARIRAAESRHLLVAAAAQEQRQYASLDMQAAADRESYETQQVANATLLAAARKECDCPVTEHHFKKFGELFAHHALRRTKGDVRDDHPEDAEAHKFWSDLRLYLDAYFQGEFVTHFGTPLPRPSIGMTISDADLTNALVVFLEYLFDVAFETPVWSEPSGLGRLYYPGGTSLKPTSLRIFPHLEVAFTREQLATQAGCGMTPAKTTAVGMLAAGFSSAASTQVGLAIGSVGGINAGLTAGVGFLGKLSIGDNKLFLSIAQAAVAEIAARWTVEITYPVLEGLDFSGVPILSYEFTAPFKLTGTSPDD